MTAPEDVGALRRYVRARAIAAGASSSDTSRLELIATELATNTLRHATPHGYVLVQSLAPPQPAGIELIAVDNGPGIRNVRAALHGEAHVQWAPLPDGTTTAQGLGCGLGSVQRLASEFDIHSKLGQGTVVLARLFFEAVASDRGPIRWGAVSVPVLGEVENGDTWGIAVDPEAWTLALADGLGHGPAAACASRAAIDVSRRSCQAPLEACFTQIHATLRSTRGAAVSICRIAVQRDSLWFAGVGNVEGRLFRGADSTGLAPRNGTLGIHLALPKLQIRQLAWLPGDLLILHSDGLRHPFKLDDLRSHDPSLIAAVVHRDLGRTRDDATVVVVRDLRLAS